MRGCIWPRTRKLALKFRSSAIRLAVGSAKASGRANSVPNAAFRASVSARFPNPLRHDVGQIQERGASKSA